MHASHGLLTPSASFLNAQIGMLCLCATRISVLAHHNKPHCRHLKLSLSQTPHYSWLRCSNGLVSLLSSHDGARLLCELFINIWDIPSAKLNSSTDQRLCLRFGMLEQTFVQANI